MFTGIIDDVGTIDAVSHTDAGRELTIRSVYSDVQEGESIAVNGACLTVRNATAGHFSVAAVTTTLERTTIGDWTVGQRVNLERAMRAGDRLGGHIVQGHVDEVGTVRSIEKYGDALLVDIACSRDLVSMLVPRGSITVNGVSLTVNEIVDDSVVQVSLIEYTLAHTALGELEPGSHVHVEGDVIGKYVRRLVAPYAEATHG